MTYRMACWNFRHAIFCFCENLCQVNQADDLQGILGKFNVSRPTAIFFEF